MLNYQAIVTSHTNTSLSGVAKFNHILANNLAIKSLSAKDLLQNIDSQYDCCDSSAPFLFSLKIRDAEPVELQQMRELLALFNKQGLKFDLFFHTFDQLEIERELIANAKQVYCANKQIKSELEKFAKLSHLAWCPALLKEQSVDFESNLNIFSFGMAHKIQVAHYRKLQSILEQSQINYSIWVSTAFHEKSRFGDFDSINEEMHEMFGANINVLGFLSDEAVNYFLDKSDLFVSFFSGGVRSNNTSFLAAMSRAKAVLTNTDQFSPDFLTHADNYLDINQVQRSDLNNESLKRIGLRAKETYQKTSSWQSLKDLLLDGLNYSEYELIENL